MNAERMLPLILASGLIIVSANGAFADGQASDSSQGSGKKTLSAALYKMTPVGHHGWLMDQLTHIQADVSGEGHYGPVGATVVGSVIDDLHQLQANHKQQEAHEAAAGIEHEQGPATSDPDWRSKVQGMLGTFHDWLFAGIDENNDQFNLQQPGITPDQRQTYLADYGKKYNQFEGIEQSIDNTHGEEFAKTLFHVADKKFDEMFGIHDGGDGTPGGPTGSGGSWGQYLNNPQGAQAYQQGMAAMQSGDYAAAQSMADSALQQNPYDLNALRLAAQSSALLGDKAAANRAANDFLQINPNDEKMATLAAITEDKSINGASEAAAQAGGLNPGGTAGAYGSGGLLNPGMIGHALTPDEAAAGSLARDAKMQAAIDPDSAINLASKAIALDSHNADAYFARGTAYGIKGEYDKGLKDAMAGLAADPHHAGLLALRAQILARQGRYADAQAAAEAALQVNPKNAAAWFAEANALAGEGQRDRALEALKNAAELNPAYASVYDTAMNAPKDSDLLFLFANPNPQANAVATSAHKKWRFGAIVGVAVAGGGLLAFGLLPFLMPPIKSAFTKLTRRASSVHAAPMEVDALADADGLLRGKYRAIRQIGAGGMGMVYEGEDISLGRKVAIKRMRDEIRSDPRERARFVSEAKVVAALHHPNIVDIYSIVDDGDDAFLVFEYIQGRTLHELVQSKGRLTLDETLPILRGVVDGLEYAHERGVIHRDLKPSNIMLDETGRPRVMDFGIARMAQEALTRAAVTNTIVGTPPYMAPEQEQGLVRKESDVYALSVCLYEMLTGRMAFAGTGAGMLMNKINKAFAPVTTLAPELPPEMDAVFAEALDPDPAKRIPSPRDLLARIEAVAASRKA